MKKKYTFPLLLLFLLNSCKNASQKEAFVSNISIANNFVDAFYSFNKDSLQAVLSDAKDSKPNILYYQKWAECANYKVLSQNNFLEKNDSLVVCRVTVKDDLMAALKIDFNVTDTFLITIKNKKISSIKTSSNDPPEYYDAKEWVKHNRPDLVKKACIGIWNGGPTPCECVQGMLKGFRALKRQ
jgi:hypothetical protein